MELDALGIDPGRAALLSSSLRHRIRAGSMDSAPVPAKRTVSTFPCGEGTRKRRAYSLLPGWSTRRVSRRWRPEERAFTLVTSTPDSAKMTTLDPGRRISDKSSQITSEVAAKRAESNTPAGYTASSSERIRSQTVWSLNQSCSNLLRGEMTSFLFPSVVSPQ